MPACPALDPARVRSGPAVAPHDFGRFTIGCFCQRPLPHGFGGGALCGGVQKLSAQDRAARSAPRHRCGANGQERHPDVYRWRHEDIEPKTHSA